MPCTTSAEPRSARSASSRSRWPRGRPTHSSSPPRRGWWRRSRLMASWPSAAGGLDLTQHALLADLLGGAELLGEQAHAQFLEQPAQPPGVLVASHPCDGVVESLDPM